MNIYLIRHGEAAARWSESSDAPLSELGRKQAWAVRGYFDENKPMMIVSSPLLRAQETAAPLASFWGIEFETDDNFRELPSLVSFEERVEWLKEVMQRTWDQVDDALIEWRGAVWRAVSSLGSDTVIFSHFMVINAVLSMVTDSIRVVGFEPDYASITRLTDRGNGIELSELGKGLNTTVP